MKAVARELGKGAFGSVVEVIDLETGEITAEKKFAKQNGFEEEKHIYDELNSSYSGDQKKLLNSLSILPSHYDMPLKTIHFAVGQASLMDLKKSEIFQFNSQHLVHLFTRMLNFILVLKDKGYCHSDLKPENVTLVRVTDNLYEARIIDFGELTKN
jgi:serine/threonine protein kinase